MNFRKHFPNEPMQLQLAPFIDVILFLLTFFLLTWSIAQYEAELGVSLPVAKHSEEETRLPGEILINILQDGSIVVNSNNWTQEKLAGTLKEMKKNFPEQAVIIRADALTNYQNVISVIDICKSAQIWNIAFSTIDPEKN